jgi:Tfp pilus tip-associated adhesin PilY1
VFASGYENSTRATATAKKFVTNTLVDNVTQYVYGGDLAGNPWRFDLTASSSQRLGRTSAVAGDQPIAVRPELGRVKGTLGVYHRVVYFGAGRYLGMSDVAGDSPSSTIAKAIYAAKDSGEDLGEGVNVDARLRLGSLVVLSNSPEDDECTIGGRSRLRTPDFRTGGPLVTQRNMAVGQSVGASVGTGLSLTRLPNKRLVAVVAIADTSVGSLDVPVAPSAGREVRRVGWRELN